MMAYLLRREDVQRFLDKQLARSSFPPAVNVDHSAANLQTVHHALASLKDNDDSYDGGLLDQQTVQESLYNPSFNMSKAYQDHEQHYNDKDRAKSKLKKVAVIAVAALTWKMLSLKVAVPKLKKCLVAIILLQAINILDTISFEVRKFPGFIKGFEFYMTMAGGNIVGTLLKILDKASYMETRIMDAQLKFEDQQRQISCFKFV